MGGILEHAKTIESRNARLRLGFPWWLRPFLVRGVIAITLGRTIYVQRSFNERPDDEIARLVRHELAHVRQVARLGFTRFVWRYLAEYFALRRARFPPAEAYRRISFEVEAHAAEDEA